jgi:hypothetical protein
MFLSPIFRETLAGETGAIELYNTDGSIGAARGARQVWILFFGKMLLPVRKIEQSYDENKNEYEAAYQIGNMN